jgi:hypothetical protein
MMFVPDLAALGGAQGRIEPRFMIDERLLLRCMSLPL